MQASLYSVWALIGANRNVVHIMSKILADLQTPLRNTWCFHICMNPLDPQCFFEPDSTFSEIDSSRFGRSISSAAKVKN